MITIFSEYTIDDLLDMAIQYDPAFCPNGCGCSYIGTGRKNNLKKHITNMCGVNNKFQCKLCQKRLRQKRSLKYHMATAHR